MESTEEESDRSDSSVGNKTIGSERPVTILLVEDDDLTQKIVTRLLASLNFQGWYCSSRAVVFYFYTESDDLNAEMRGSNAFTLQISSHLCDTLSKTLLSVAFSSQDTLLMKWH